MEHLLDLQIVDGDYHYVLFDQSKQRLRNVKVTDHKPHFLSPEDEIVNVEGTGLVLSKRKVTKLHPITHEMTAYWDCVIDKPYILNQIAPRDDLLRSKLYESHISYEDRVMVDKNLFFNMSIDPKDHVKKDGYDSWMDEIYYKMFNTPFLKMDRCAIDIETLESEGVLKTSPDPEKAEHAIISIACAWKRQGEKVKGVVGVLSCKHRDVKDKRHDELGKMIASGEVERIVFQDERGLLEWFFGMLKLFPCYVSYNGDHFDFPYAHNRAVTLGIKNIPIKVWKNKNSGEYESSITGALHLDLMKFLKQPAIKSYAFPGMYDRVGLAYTSAAFLDYEKVDTGDKKPMELNLSELIYYNYIDAKATLDITLVQNELVFELILTLSRLCRVGFHKCWRKLMSSKIQNMYYMCYIPKDIVIPNMEELIERDGVIIKGEKGIKGGIFKVKEGTYFDLVLVDFTALYPSIIQTRNIGILTMNCNHEQCKSNKVPGLKHHICTVYRDPMSEAIGYLKDMRAAVFKPKSKTDVLAKTVSGAIKIVTNACLSINEKLLAKDELGYVQIVKLQDLSKGKWKVISTDEKGHIIWTDVINYQNTGFNDTLKVTLIDGRSIITTRDHMVPIWKKGKIVDVEAEDLKIKDEMIYVENMPYIHTKRELFILDYVDCYVSIDRKDFTRLFGYRLETSPKWFQENFKYSPMSKKYFSKVRWNMLDSEIKHFLKEFKGFKIKDGLAGGKWINHTIKIDSNVVKLFGYFVSEGSSTKNRITVSQYIHVNPTVYHSIKICMCKLNIQLGLNHLYCNDTSITLNNRIVGKLFHKLMGRGSENKKLPLKYCPIDLLDDMLHAYFEGDGNYFNGLRQYTTKSKTLIEQLSFIHNLNKISHSIQNHSKDCYRVSETQGKNYRRGKRETQFGDSKLVRIKSIKPYKNLQTCDITTSNGHFVLLNGMKVHNCYGILASVFFPFLSRASAESITAYGRTFERNIEEKIIELGGESVILATDSNVARGLTSDDVKTLMQHSLDQLNLALEKELEYSFLIVHAKSNYLGVDTDGNLHIKGLTGKKRNTPKFVVRAFKEMLNELKCVRCEEDLVKAKANITHILVGYVNDVETGRLPIEDFVIDVELRSEIKDYKVHGPHVKVAVELEALGIPVRAGNIISMVYTNRGPKHYKFIHDLREINSAKYIERLLSTVSTITDPLGIDPNVLIRQETLSDWFT